jgi:hypothetical protein
LVHITRHVISICNLHLYNNVWSDGVLFAHGLLRETRMLRNAGMAIWAWLCVGATLLPLDAVGESAWRRVSALPLQEPMARLQVEMYLVVGKAESLRELAAADTRSWPTAGEKFSRKLGEYGSARHEGRFDEKVGLATRTVLKSLGREPVRMGGANARSAEIKYQDVGCSVELQGSWLERESKWVSAITTRLEVGAIVNLADVGSQPADGEAARPLLMEARLSAARDLESGRPQILVGDVAGSTSLGQWADLGAGRINGVLVACITLTRETRPSASSAAQGAGRPSDADAKPLQFDVEVFELRGEQSKLAFFEPEDLGISADASAEEVVKTLGERGEAELLSKPRLIVRGNEKAGVQVSERLPVPDSGPGSSGAAGAPDAYKYVGIELAIQAKWLENVGPDFALVQCGVKSTTPAQVKAGQPSDVSHLSQAYEALLKVGDATWLPHRTMMWPGGREPGKADYLLVRMRLRRPGEGEGQASRPVSGEAVASVSASKRPDPLAQVELWKLVGDPAKLADVDLNQLLAGPLSESRVVEQLAAFGKAERIASTAEVLRPDQTIEAKVGVRPTSSEPAVQASGGARAWVRGAWSGEKPGVARLSFGLDAWGVASLDESQEGDDLGCREQRSTTIVELKAGESRWIKTCWSKTAAAGSSVPATIVLARASLFPAAAESPPTEQSARASEASESEATRLQINLFELECPAETFLKTDFGSLSRDNITSSKLLAALNRLGQAQLTRTADCRVGDLRWESAVDAGERVPKMRAFDGGRGASRTMYDSLGAKVQWQGMWTGEEPDRALLDLEIRQSGRDQSVAMGLGLPILIKIHNNIAVALTNGQPVLQVSKRISEKGDAEKTKLDLMQIVVLRAADARVGTPRERAEGVAAALRAGPASHVRFEMFVTELPTDRLPALAEMGPDAVGSSIALQGRLEALGPTQLAAAADWDVLLTAENELKVGARVPAVAPSSSGAASSLRHHSAGYEFSIMGQWRERDPAVADIHWAVEHSDVKDPTDGSALPAFTDYKTDRQSLVRDGEPLLVLGTQAGGAPGKTRLLSMRLVVGRGKR